ncbi:MAG TPA: hypothetical protein PK890_05285 [Terrimesophilobacter sp.]|nr:hypothetical protein [Terrimesophilobacter sp.]
MRPPTDSERNSAPIRCASASREAGARERAVRIGGVAGVVHWGSSGVDDQIVDQTSRHTETSLVSRPPTRIRHDRVSSAPKCFENTESCCAGIRYAPRLAQRQFDERSPSVIYTTIAAAGRGNAGLVGALTA